jgi:Holliday junction resolvase-like predicted endonuclease
LHWRNQTGAVAEEIAILHFLRNGFFVFRPILGFGPVDLVALNADGEILLLDVKADNKRLNTGQRKTATRITRKRTILQKFLGVRLCYVNLDEETVHVSDHAAN